MSVQDSPHKGIFDRFAILLVDHRVLLFVIMTALSLGSLYYSQFIKIDNSLELWFLEGDPALTAYREFKKIYGNDEIILALVDSGSSDGVFKKDFLNGIYSASKKLEADSTNFRRVISLGVSPHIDLQNGNELVVEDLMTATAADDLAAENIRRKFMDDPFKQKLLTDMGRRYGIFLIEPVASTEMDAKRPEIIAAAKTCLQGLNYQLAGMGIMYDELNRLSLRDGMIFTTVSYLVILLVVFLLFRSWVFLSMVICVMLLGTTTFIGVYGLFRQNFNMVTIVLPTLMLILSISDVAYIFNQYVVNMGKMVEDKRKGLIFIFGNALAPCLFTSLTNLFGFISIVLSPMQVLRGFGYFASFSTLAEYFISMISAAFILGFVTPDTSLEERRPFANYVEKWVRLMPRYHGTVLILLVVSSVFGFVGIAHLQVDTYSMGFLQEDNPVRVQSDYVEKNYGDYLPLEIRLLTGKPDGVKDPGFLRRLAACHDNLEKLPEVQRAASMVDVMKRLNQVMTDGASTSYVVPDTPEKVSQLLMLYESDPDNDMKHMVDPSYREARLTVRVPMVSAANLHRIESMVLDTLKKEFSGTSVEIVFGGYVPLYARLINYITQSQLTSFATALIGIFGAMALLFRRFDAVWLGIVPNVYPIIMTLGMMGWLGIRLDIATVTIASIALGVAVNDTIHELFLFYKPERRHLDPVDSISEVLIEEGPAVVATSLIYAFGFSALALASIKSVIYFGALLAMTLIFGMICEVSMMPALVCQFKEHLAQSRQK